MVSPANGFSMDLWISSNIVTYTLNMHKFMIHDDASRTYINKYFFTPFRHPYGYWEA